MIKLIIKFTLIALLPYLIFKFGYILLCLLISIFCFSGGYLLIQYTRDKNDYSKKSEGKVGVVTLLFVAFIVFLAYLIIDKEYTSLWFNTLYVISFFGGIILHHKIIDETKNEIE